MKTQCAFFKVKGMVLTTAKHELIQMILKSFKGEKGKYDLKKTVPQEIFLGPVKNTNHSF